MELRHLLVQRRGLGGGLKDVMAAGRDAYPEQIHVMVKIETLTYFNTSNCGVLKDSMMLSSTCNASYCYRQTGQVDVIPAVAAATAQEKHELDLVYHLRMSYWCYRIVDCFGISRKIDANTCTDS